MKNLKIDEEKTRFIPYRRFILLLKIDENGKLFYSTRFCRQLSAFQEAEKIGKFKGIDPCVYDTKKQQYITES